MELIPNATRRYAEADYWEKRFETECHHEWFSDYAQFRHLLRPFIPPTARILILGNGTSRLPLDLQEDGLRHITATDICQTLIETLHAEYGGSGLTYEVADMLALPYSDGAFDVVIEKGTLDVLFADAPSQWDPPEAVCRRMDAACREIHRVLSPAGQFFSITFTQPLFREPHLTRHTWSCAIDRFGEPGSLEYYVYRLDKAAAPAEAAAERLEDTVDIDSMHRDLDDVSFLARIDLTDSFD